MTGSAGAAFRDARTCYDHLAGRLGVALADALVAGGILVEVPERVPARGPALALADAGRERLAALGIVLAGTGRRPPVRACLDRTERRPHVGGALGAALLDAALARGWVCRAEGRVVRLTPAGRSALVVELGLDPMFGTGAMRVPPR